MLLTRLQGRFAPAVHFWFLDKRIILNVVLSQVSLRRSFLWIFFCLFCLWKLFPQKSILIAANLRFRFRRNPILFYIGFCFGTCFFEAIDDLIAQLSFDLGVFWFCDFVRKTSGKFFVVCIGEFIQLGLFQRYLTSLTKFQSILSYDNSSPGAI